MNSTKVLRIALLVLVFTLVAFVFSANLDTPTISPRPSGTITTSSSPSGIPSNSPSPLVDSDITIAQPISGAVVSSPLIIKGQARGNWYFEAQFPVRLLDGSGKEIARGIAQAQGEWMTEAFVPFEATLTFDKPVSGTGQLILQKDNPSGLPENDKSISVPVKF